MDLRTLTALMTVYVIWGSTYFAIAVAIETLPPFLMAGVRFVIAGLLFMALLAIRPDRPSRQHPAKAQYRTAFIVGGALLLGGNGAVVWAEQRVPSGIAALMIGAIPMWMAVMDRIFFGRRLTRMALAGIVVGFFGIALLVAPTDDVASIDPLGAAALVFAPISWAAGSLYARKAPAPDSTVRATAQQMLAGGLLLILAGVVTGEIARVDLAEVSVASATAMGYLVIFGSLIAYSAYIWLLRNAQISLVSTYAYVNPVVAVLLGWGLLNEPVTARTLVAGAIIIAGVAGIVASQTPKDPDIGHAAAPADAPPVTGD